jgi:hypothetical protein
MRSRLPAYAPEHRCRVDGGVAVSVAGGAAVAAIDVLTRPFHRQSTVAQSPVDVCIVGFTRLAPGVHQPDPPGLIHDDLRLLPPWRGSSLFQGWSIFSRRCRFCAFISAPDPSFPGAARPCRSGPAECRAESAKSCGTTFSLARQKSCPQFAIHPHSACVLWCRGPPRLTVEPWQRTGHWR